MIFMIKRLLYVIIKLVTLPILACIGVIWLVISLILACLMWVKDGTDIETEWADILEWLTPLMEFPEKILPKPLNGK